MKFTFIKEHREEFPVVDMCRVLEVSKSGFYRWIMEPVGKHERRRQELGDAAEFPGLNAFVQRVS